MADHPSETASGTPELTADLRKRIVLEEQLKAVSEPLKLRQLLWSGIVITTALTASVGVWFWAIDALKGNWWILLFIPLGVAIYFALGISTAVFMRSRLQRELATTITASKSEELQERLDENFFTNLVKINFKYIDKYYLQTQLQADKSFFLCAIASCVSLLVIIAGIVLLFVEQTAKDAGYVATAAGTLGEFIAAVFFYLYNRTIMKMGEYHQKLVLTQNVSLALKITEDLPATEQTTARVQLIEYLSKDINLYLTAKTSEETPLSRKG